MAKSKHRDTSRRYKDRKKYTDPVSRSGTQDGSGLHGQELSRAAADAVKARKKRQAEKITVSEMLRRRDVKGRQNAGFLSGDNDNFYRDTQKKEAKKHERFFSYRPNTLLIGAAGFFLVILLGAILLSLPIANASGHRLNFLDALFTATTSACVTGLVTVTPATQFTIFGKVVILILIQIGGWGVIVCTVGLMIILRRKIMLNTRILVSDYFGMDTMSGVVRMLIYVVKASLVVEGLGALGYSFIFLPKYGVLCGIWYSIFHSISAFCNAGVDLLGDSSLMNYSGNVLMNIVTMTLIVVGGLGFAVWKDLTAALKFLLRKGNRSFSERRRLVRRDMLLQTKLVLPMTVVLICFGAVLFYLIERENPATFGQMGEGQKIMASIFQSVTTRTAGFAMVSQKALTDGSKFISIILMLIGGSPAGTAGGIKTVTIAVLFATIWSILQGHSDTECFQRKISPEIVRTAIAVVTMCLFLFISGTVLLMVMEPKLAAIDAMYEIASAVATVGLTADVTGTLRASSKVLIIILMYFGRLGPVTIPMLIAGSIGKGKKSDKRTLPEEHIVVG